MTNQQLKQARRDRREKQIALYGYWLDPAPECKKKTIRWGAVFLAVCVAVFFWFFALIIIDSL